MMFTLIFLALLMAALVGWLLKQSLGVQPWLSTTTAEMNLLDHADRPYVGQLGLVVLLAVITSLFALFVSAFYMRMHMPDWQPLIEPQLLWVNTGVLLAGSLALQVAWQKSITGTRSSQQLWLVIGVVLIGTFIVGQFIAWQQLQANGFYASSNPANAFFYTLTGLHALHLLGGLIALTRAIRAVWSRAETRPGNGSLRLCAWYFHYLLIIWLFLFIVMLIN